MKVHEDLLFSEWKQYVYKSSPTAIFVTDGIVSEKGWNNAPVKVLYLLKEVNGGDNEWDERDYLANYNRSANYINTHSPTIDVLIKWQYGIIDGGKSTWEQVDKRIASKDTQDSLLSQICLVNIKKTAGGGIVDWDQFEAYFANTENHTFLNRQLLLYKPHVVVCGGTAWHLCKIKGWDYNKWPQTSRGIRYFTDEDTTYIEFCHPNNRGPKNMIYYALVDALKELKLLG